MSRHCFVPRCNSCYLLERNNCKKNNLRPASVFKAPKDPDMLRLWQLSIPRLGFSSSDSVCEKHFSDKFIERYFRTKLPNNEEHLIERERPTLLPNAVPTKFFDGPIYSCKTSPTKRKPLTDCNSANNNINNARATKQKKLSMSISPNDKVHEIQIPEDICEIILEQENQVTSTPSVFTFDILQRHDIERYSWFKLDIREEKVVRILYWPSGQIMCLKYVDIYENLSVKIILGSVSSSFVGYEKIDSWDHLQKLFDVVERTIICPGAILNKFNNCRGFLIGTDEYCPKCKRRRISHKETVVRSNEFGGSKNEKEANSV